MSGRTSRRDFMKQAALTGAAAALALGHGGASAQSPTKGRAGLRAGGRGVPVTRRDIGSMRPDDEQLLMFREAVRVMKGRSEKNPLDPGGWLVHATQHSIFCATQDYGVQVHYNWFFLPWHRAYLWSLEKNMQEVIGEPTLALPYWDWTRSPRIPAAFWGAGNPLNNVTRLQEAGDEIPADFIDVAPILRVPKFKFFGGFPKTPEPSDQVEGIVEQGVHNNTHNWIGGDMAGFPTAGLDGIFCTHHGQIDRLWEAWRASDKGRRNPSDRRWLDQVFTFYRPDGRPRRVAVKDLVDTEAIGYRYDTLDFKLTLPERDDARLWRESETGRAQTVPVSMDHGRHAEMFMGLAGGGRRVILSFERMLVPVHPLCVRVFFNRPEAGQGTPVTSPSYAGTFTLLPVGGPRAGLETVVTMQMEVGREVAALLHAQRDVSVSLVPVPLKGRVLPQQTIELKGAKLSFDEE